MKIIHTSDWHIGQVFYNYHRDDEHKCFFEQLKSLIKNEKPDALIVSGDIFHNPMPSLAAQRLYYKTLVDLSHVDDDLQIVVTAGNHDSPSRIEIPKVLLEAFNVHVVGFVAFIPDGDISFDASKLIVPIHKDNNLVGWVLAVPFINIGNYPQHGNNSYSERVASFYSSLLNSLRNHEEYNDEQPVVAMGHLPLFGADIQGHDNGVIGGQEIIDATCLNEIKSVDYWAFGHIHRPQYIKGLTNARYAGSPFNMSFDENYKHSVSVVDISNKTTKISEHYLESLVPTIDFPNKPATFAEAHSYQEVMSQLDDILDKKCYVRLHVAVEMPLNQYQTYELLKRFDGRNAMFCLVKTYSRELNDNENDTKIHTLEDFKALSPFDIGCEYYEKRNNTPMPDAMKKIFKEICERVEKLEK